MKKVIILLLLFVSPAVGLRAQTLVLHHPGNTTTEVDLFTMPRIEFEGDRVLITSTVLDMEYPKDQVLRFTYKGTVTTAVGTQRAEADYSRDGDRLVFRGIKADDQIAVYTSNGIRVPVSLTRSGSTAALSLSAIPKGVYLLSVNGRTSKFTRQ